MENVGGKDIPTSWDDVDFGTAALSDPVACRAAAMAIQERMAAGVRRIGELDWINDDTCFPVGDSFSNIWWEAMRVLSITRFIELGDDEEIVLDNEFLSWAGDLEHLLPFSGVSHRTVGLGREVPFLTDNARGIQSLGHEAPCAELFRGFLGGLRAWLDRMRYTEDIYNSCSFLGSWTKREDGTISAGNRIHAIHATDVGNEPATKLFATNRAPIDCDAILVCGAHETETRQTTTWTPGSIYTDEGGDQFALGGTQVYILEERHNGQWLESERTTSTVSGIVPRTYGVDRRNATTLEVSARTTWNAAGTKSHTVTKQETRVGTPAFATPAKSTKTFSADLFDGFGLVNAPGVGGFRKRVPAHSTVELLDLSDPRAPAVDAAALAPADADDAAVDFECRVRVVLDYGPYYRFGA